VIEAERRFLMGALGAALVDTLGGGQSQISYQLSLGIKRLPEEEWNWILSTVIGKLEDVGITFVVDRQDER
jgi:hypothetical protein